MLFFFNDMRYCINHYRFEFIVFMERFFFFFFLSKTNLNSKHAVLIMDLS